MNLYLAKITDKNYKIKYELVYAHNEHEASEKIFNKLKYQPKQVIIKKPIK